MVSALPGRSELQYLARVLQPCTPQTFSPGTALYHAGESATHFFWLRSGVVKLSRPSTQHSPPLIMLIGRPRPIGLADLFRGTFSTTAVALTEVKACRIERTQVVALLHEHALLFQALARKLELELRRLEERIGRQRFYPTSYRLALVLRDLMYELTLSQDNTLHLPLRWTELAEMVGVAPRTLRRALHTLEQQGLIQRLGRHHLRLYPEGLALWLQTQAPAPFSPKPNQQPNNKE